MGRPTSDRPTAMKALLYLIRERGREIRVEVVTEGDPTSFVIQMQEKWRARGGIEKEIYRERGGGQGKT